MCLYQREIHNPKYLPTIKNGGKAPKPKDYRQIRIKIDCGWCEECRRKIANEWKVRLFEEIKENKNCEFVTLSFSPESIAQLEKEIIEKAYKGIDGTEIDVNIMAAYAIRKWTERWRKSEKKAPRHWLITELGHKNSERLHLHGLIWNLNNENKEEFQKKIEKTWSYGNIYCGNYVNEQSINYITKYVTKLDEYNKGYKQKIFSSQKIGLSYIENGQGKRIHEFRKEKTELKYRLNNGVKLQLPKYYKQKLFTEEQREELWSYALDKEEIWLGRQKYKNISTMSTKEKHEFIKQLKGKRKTNEAAGYGDLLTGNLKYIITDAMKMSYNELMDYDRTKLVKAVERREIIQQKTKHMNLNEDVNKGMGVTYNIMGDYKGTTTETERKRNNEKALAKLLGISMNQLKALKGGVTTYELKQRHTETDEEFAERTKAYNTITQ